jgi:hypothetical protein
MQLKQSTRSIPFVRNDVFWKGIIPELMEPLTAAPTVAVLLYASAKSEENRTLLIASFGFLCIFP